MPPTVTLSLFNKISSRYFDIDVEELDYEELCKDLRKISGAEYTVINFLTPDQKYTQTIAVSGISSHVKKAIDLFGFELIGRKWEVDRMAIETMNTRSLISQGDIAKATPHLKAKLVKTLKKIFRVGEIYSIGLFSHKEVIGTVVFVMKDGEKISNPELVELFSNQVSGLIYRREAEKRLKAEQEKIAIVSQNSPDQLVLVTTDWKIQYLNRFLWSHEKSPQAGDNMLDFVSSENRNLFRVWLPVVMKSGKSLEKVITIPDTEGHTKYFFIWITPLLEKEEVTSIYIVSRDITEQSNLTARLIEQSFMLRESNRVARIGSWEMDIETGLVKSSDELNGILGKKTTESFTLENVILLFEPGDREVIRNAIDEAVKLGKGYDHEFMITTLDGKKKWIRSIANVLTENGIPKKIVGIAQDNTEYRSNLAEQESIREQLSQFQHALNNASIISRTDPEGNLIFVNDNFLKVSKYSYEELIGRNHNVVKSTQHSRVFWESFWKQLSEGLIWKGEIKNTAKDGTEYWVDTTIIPLFKPSGDIYEFISISSDITAKKANELEAIEIKERLRDIVSSIDDVLFELDLVTGRRYYSENIQGLLGYSTDDFRRDPELWTKLLHPSDADTVRRDIALFLKGKTPPVYECRVINRNGIERNLLIRPKTVKNEKGVPVRFFAVVSDITSLKETERRLAQAQRIAKIGSWEFDLRTQDLTWSDEHYRIFELEKLPKEKLYSSYRKKILPDDLPQLDFLINRALLTGEGFHYEHRILSSDGSVKTIMGISECVRNESGEPVLLRGTAQDISNVKKTEEELFALEKKLNDIINNIDAAMWSVDVEGNFIFINDGCEKMHGYKPEEFYADKNLWKKLYLPEDLVWLEERYAKLFETGLLEYESRLVAKSGRLYWMHVKMKLVCNSAGKPMRVDSFATDITARKHAEAELERRNEEIAQITSAINNSALVTLTDIRGTILRVNDTFCLTSGYSEKELIGRNHSIVNSGYHDKSFWSDFWQTITSGKIWKGNVCNRKKNGQVYWVYSVINPICDEHGKVVRFLSIRYDITAEKCKEEELSKTKDQLKNIIESIDSVVWSIDEKTNEFVYLSPNVSKIFGYTTEELKNPSDWPRLLLEEEDMWSMEARWKALKEVGFVEVEHSIKTKEGEKKFISEKIWLILDDNGQPIRRDGVIVDITERKRFEQTLVEKEKEVSSILNSAPDAIVVVNSVGTIVEWNPMATQLFGWTTGEVVGKLLTETIIPPRYRQAHTYAMQRYINTGDSVVANTQKEIVAMRKNGTEFPVSLSISEAEILGQVYFIGFINDITVRKKTEEELQQAKQKLDSIFNEMQDVVWSLSLPERRMLFMTPSAEELYKIPYEKLMRDGSLWEKQIIEEDREVIERIYATLEKQGHYEEEYRIVDSLGVLKWVRNRGKVISDESGNPLRVDCYLTDISESKFSEQILRNSERNLKEAEHIAKLGRWELDLVNNFLYWSDSIFEIWEVPNQKGKATYENFLESIHPEDREMVNKAYSDSLQNKTPYAVEHRLLFPGGRVKWVKESCRTDYDENGKPLRSVGIVYDITEVKLAQIELIKVKESLEKTSEVAGIGGWEIDLASNRLYWSEITRRIHEVDDIYEPSLEEAISFYKKGWSRNTIRKAIDRSIRIGVGFNLELKLITAREREIWVEAVGETEMADSRVTRVYGTFRDITDRKQSELEIQRQNEFQKLIADISAKLVKAKADDIGEALEDSLGRFAHFMDVERCFIMQIDMKNASITNTHDWHANHLSSMSHRLQARPLRDFPWFAREIAKQQTFVIPDIAVAPAEAVEEKKEWEIQKIRSLAFLRLDSNNEPFGLIGVSTSTYYRSFSTDEIDKIKVIANIFSDALSKSKLEREALLAKEQAVSANKAKTEFLANISHEIRTPMNAILGFADLLKGKTISPKYEAYLEGILTGGKSLLSLINDILDLSKIESGRMEIKEAPVNIQLLLQELFGIFSQKANEKKLAFRYDISPTVPSVVLLDEIRFKQILFNLLGNALKFTEKGEVALLVNSQPVTHDDSKINLFITVSDTGIGIPDDQRERIFEPFKQMEGQSNRRFGGTGLGLSITKRLVTMMGGSIGLISTTGKGSSFTVSLYNISIAVAGNEEIRSESGETYEYRFFGQRILLVEDIASNREVVRGFLEPYNLQVSEAENGRLALDKLHEIKPDLILMDMMMPVMDGYEATKAIRCDPAWNDVPIVALTASALNQNETNIREICNDYLRKPIMRADLLNTLAAHLKSEKIQTSAEAESRSEGTEAIVDMLEGEPAKRFAEQWNNAAEIMSLDDIRRFAGDLLAFGRESENQELIRYAGRLVQAADGFEIEEMNNLFNMFSSADRSGRNKS